MYKHAPDDYICPFCLLVQGVDFYCTQRALMAPEKRAEHAAGLRARLADELALI